MFLGIDLGTQGVKALLYDPDSRQVVATGRAPLELISRADGSREQLAGWWLDALRQSLDQVPAALRARVLAIGVSGQQHGFVPLAADGTVLAPVKLWCDTATTAECDEITAAFGGEAACIAEVGNPILPGYTASKIRWLSKHRPDDYARMATLLLPHDYLNYYLTGERVMECGDASGTGLLDVRTRQWHAGMAAAVDGERDIRDCLPPLIGPGEPAGQLLPTIAAELGLPAGLPVSCGGGDNMMAAIGTGNVAPGRLTVSLGTSGTLFAHADRPIVDEGGTLAAFCDSTGGWLPLVCTMNCTVATELTRDLLDLDIDALESSVAGVPPGASGVLTLPFFNGERTPSLPGGKGCLFGLDGNNYTRGNLLRSAMESAIYGLRAGLDALRGQGLAFETVRLTGGGAGSASWRQMAADIFNLPVTVQRQDEGAALGAALQALWLWQGGTGLSQLVDEHLECDPDRACLPSPTRVADYDHHYARYQSHVAAIAPLYQTNIEDSRP